MGEKDEGRRMKDEKRRANLGRPQLWRIGRDSGMGKPETPRGQIVTKNTT
jgi:hypothetical protein